MSELHTVTVRQLPSAPATLQQALLQRGDASAAFERAEQCCRSFEKWRVSAVLAERLWPRQHGGSAEWRTRAPSLPGEVTKESFFFIFL